MAAEVQHGIHATYNYDTVLDTNILLSDYAASKKREPSVTLTDVWRRYHPDSQQSMRRYQLGTHCVGMAMEACKRFPMHGAAHVVGFTFRECDRPEANDARLHHAAALVHYRNEHNPADSGYVLMDPGFPMPNPVLIRRGEMAVEQVGSQTWKFSICRNAQGEEQIRWTTTYARSNTERVGHFETKEYKNPEDCTVRQFLAARQERKIISLDESGRVRAYLTIDFSPDHRTILISQGDKKRRVDFGAFQANPRAYIDSDFAASLRTNAEELHNRVGQLIAHEADLRDLRAQVFGCADPRHLSHL